MSFINLHYVRAAVEQATGQRISFPELRQLLVEEGLITKQQADEDAIDFRGYSEFYETESFDRDVEDRVDIEEGLPDEEEIFNIQN